MQTCNCTNGYHYKGTCCVCDADWPLNDELTLKAKKLYKQHLNLNSNQVDYMWKQCSQEYRDAWLLIAKE